MSFYIIADSGSDLPPDTIKQYNLKVIPLKVYLDNVEYADGMGITPKEVFDRMRAGVSARTAQVTTQEFIETFEEHAKEGHSVVYLAFSSGLSGTLNAANIAKDDVLGRFPDFDLTIIDTKCASVGYGMVVRRALEMKAGGAAKDEVIDAAHFHSQHMCHIFTVDDLEYLYRGGRVSRTSALIGGMLGIKPVLHVNDEGKLIPLTKVKGRQNAIKKVASLVAEQGVNLDHQVIGISHGDDFEAVETLKSLLKENLGCNNFFVSYVGCTIGAHSGPGTLAVFFLDCDSPYEKYFVI